jgi:hypothetical protein
MSEKAITRTELRKILANKTEEDFIKVINTFPVRQPKGNECHFIEYQGNRYLNKDIIRELTKPDRQDGRDIPSGTGCAKELNLFIKDKKCKQIKYVFLS